jgi:hypothetical protein
MVQGFHLLLIKPLWVINLPPLYIQWTLFCATKLINTYMKYECYNCKSEFKNTQGLAMHQKSCNKPKRIFNCKQCGAEKIFKHTSTNQYCSHKCAQIASRVEKDEAHYKHKRAISNEAWQRYHARQKAQTPADADLKLMQPL